MAQPYIGEIRLFAGNFAPVGWLFCEGQLLPIAEADALYTLIGTAYGGDGQSTFGLPDLRGRIPMHMGSAQGLGNNVIGTAAGVETVTLTVQQMPVHSHPLLASNDIANSPNPGQSVLARSPQVKAFLNAAPSAGMAAQFLNPAGGSQPHENRQPYLCINYIISLFGIFPSQT